MDVRWWYRFASFLGTAVLTITAVTIANYPDVQQLLGVLPLLGQLPKDVLVGDQFLLAVGTTLAVMLVTLAPLFKPQPRRILDVIALTEKRVFISAITLAAIGYFDYTYRLPRLTLVIVASVLLTVLPLLFVTIRRRPRGESRAIVIGTEKSAIADVVRATELEVIGYVSPPTVDESGGRAGDASEQPARPATDGGGQPSLTALDCLGGFARLDDILVEYDVDTALLAFDETDRGEFFGTLDSCYRHGVTAKIHRDHAHRVLTNDLSDGPLVTIDLEPWDWQDHVVKRGFDIAFASIALVVLSPVIVLIAALVKLDSPGPVLYSQQRTAEFGETFTVYKFRSMVPDAEAETGATLSEEDRGDADPRVTRVGRVLRQTHLDEIPQLWSILVGDMSVVGPRPERPELDDDIETTVGQWRRRWFVRPGLTGLAQIRGVTGHDPEQKLRYDIEYIRKQSFWFDLKIVIRQLWLVVVDAALLMTDAD